MKKKEYFLKLYFPNQTIEFQQDMQNAALGEYLCAHKHVLVKITPTYSDDSDQPANARSLIRLLKSGIRKPWVPSYQLQRSSLIILQGFESSRV